MNIYIYKECSDMSEEGETKSHQQSEWIKNKKDEKLWEES